VIHLCNRMKAALQEVVGDKDDCYLHLAQLTYAECHPDEACSILYSGRHRRSSWETGNRTCCFASDSILARA
jgi:hypothetical protein